MTTALYCTDTLFTIISFLDNKSSSALIRTCSIIKKHGDTYGFATHMSFDSIIDTMSFIRRFYHHINTLKSVYIRGIDNPHIWIPQYVERMVFDHCCVVKEINPIMTSYVTKYLKITDYHRTKYKTKVYINWEKFPNLEKISLYVFDINLDGLNMKKLKEYNINTMSYKQFKKLS